MNKIFISAVFINSNTHNINEVSIFEKDEFTTLFKDNKLFQGTELSIDGVDYHIDKFKFEMCQSDNYSNETLSEPPFFYLKIFVTKI